MRLNAATRVTGTRRLYTLQWLLACAPLAGPAAAQEGPAKSDGFFLGMEKREVAQLGRPGILEYSDGSLFVPGLKVGSQDATAILHFNRFGNGPKRDPEEDARYEAQHAGLTYRLDRIYFRFHSNDACDVALAAIETSLKSQGRTVSKLETRGGAELDVEYPKGPAGLERVTYQSDGKPGCPLIIEFSERSGFGGDLLFNPDSAGAHPFVVQPLPPIAKPTPAQGSAPNKDTVGLLFVMFYTAQKCEAAHVAITPDMLQRMQAYVKGQIALSGMTKPEIDETWSNVQQAAAIQPVHQSDCADVTRFMGMYAPGVLVPESPNPFD